MNINLTVRIRELSKDTNENIEIDNGAYVAVRTGGPIAVIKVSNKSILGVRELEIELKSKELNRNLKTPGSLNVDEDLLALFAVHGQVAHVVGSNPWFGSRGNH